jgi:hypothetical protein
MNNDADDVEMAEVAEMAAAAFEAYEAYLLLESSVGRDGKDVKQPVIRQSWLDDPGAGLRHLDRILRGQPPRIVNYLRMTGSCFTQLCDELHDLRHTDNFPIREKVAIYLQYVGQGISERKLEEDFQRPRSKVNQTKSLVRDEIIRVLYSKYVTDLQRAATSHHLNEKHVQGRHALSWPLRGAAVPFDGVHFPARVSKEKANAYRNRKGFTSTNALLACTLDNFITYCFAGAEGTNCDPAVLLNVRDDFFSTLSIAIDLHGERVVTCFLADAIYGLEQRVMTPFRGIRYHLKEWIGLRPQNAHEMYNLQHAKLRNAIERTIGILKRRFKELRVASECDIENHVKNIYACVALHNFIKFHKGDIDDDYLEDSDIDEGDDGADMKEVRDFDDMVAAGANTASLYQAALAKREGIAQEMWTAYRQARAARGDPIP